MKWRTSRLGDVVTFQRGFDLPHRLRKQGRVPVVSSAGVTDYHALSMVQPPGVVTGRYGTVGELFFVTEPFWPLNTTLYVRDFHGNDPLFIYYFLQRFDFASFSGKSGVPGVNRNDLHAEVISLPCDVNYQRTIAMALSDVDRLLHLLDLLIAKKSDIKQAAMQQLLSGKTRLPGFTEEWKTRQIGEIADIISGGTPKTSVSEYWNGDIQWCTPTDITGTSSKNLSKTERTITELGARSSAARLLPPGTLLLCSRATIGECKIAAGPITTNQGFKSLVCRAGTDNEFLYYKILAIKGLLIEKSFGSTFLEISKANLASIEIEMPQLDEQREIARVFSDMDLELQALEARLLKTREVKQGMMQQLLTGKVRLI